MTCAFMTKHLTFSPNLPLLKKLTLIMQANSSSTLIILLLHLSIFSFLTHLSLAKSLEPVQSPSQSLERKTSFFNLIPCLTYVINGSNLTRPEKGCCSAIAGLVSNKEKEMKACWCQFISGYNNYGVQIDTIRVLTLPTICRVNAPPTSLCSVIGAPDGILSPSNEIYIRPSLPSIETQTSGKSSYSITSYTWLHLLTFSFIASSSMVY